MSTIIDFLDITDRPVLYVLNILLLDASPTWTPIIEAEARKLHYSLDYVGNFNFYVGTIQLAYLSIRFIFR
jgi:hypothetical protein